MSVWQTARVKSAEVTEIGAACTQISKQFFGLWSWLMPQGGMKLGYGGLALLALALLLRLVYAGPPDSAEYLAALPFSGALVWLVRTGCALFFGGMLSSAVRYCSGAGMACRPAGAHVRGAITALVLVALAGLLAWRVADALTSARALAQCLALVYGAYLVMAVRVPWTCVRTFGHCHRCANAARAWRGHVRETIVALGVALVVLPLLAWHGYRARAAEQPARSAWRLPNIERGRRLVAHMDQETYDLAEVDREIDELVFAGAAPLTVFTVVTNRLSGVNEDDAWDIAMYVRSKTAPPPRASLERELFERWAACVAPGAPPYVWHDWHTLRAEDDTQIAARIEAACAVAGTQRYLGAYELQRMVDLVRAMGVRGE